MTTVPARNRRNEDERPFRRGQQQRHRGRPAHRGEARGGRAARPPTHEARAGGARQHGRGGADANRREPDTGRSPLHAAVAGARGPDAPEVVRVLLDAGADVNATTVDGASALDISRVTAARTRRDDAGQATTHDALAVLLVARGATD